VRVLDLQVQNISTFLNTNKRS